MFDFESLKVFLFYGILVALLGWLGYLLTKVTTKIGRELGGILGMIAGVVLSIYLWKKYGQAYVLKK